MPLVSKRTLGRMLNYMNTPSSKRASSSYKVGDAVKVGGYGVGKITSMKVATAGTSRGGEAIHNVRFSGGLLRGETMSIKRSDLRRAIPTPKVGRVGTQSRQQAASGGGGVGDKPGHPFRGNQYT